MANGTIVSAPRIFSRKLMLDQLRLRNHWDIVVIGGGATGLGIALDAASRGHAVLLLEQHDFAKGTSSRSTKLVHGGVRYLAQGDIKLVYSALRERGILLRNAPHLVRRQSFVIPCYHTWSAIKYTAGLKFYDLLAGKQSIGRSAFISSAQVLRRFPNIKAAGLKGGVQYFDGQFDDARLAINIAQTAAEHSAVLLNYCKVNAILKKDGRVSGVRMTDICSGTPYDISSGAVINATGVFVDEVLQMDNARNKPLVAPSQGVHIVISKDFLKGTDALMIPETTDGRVLFAVPWHQHLLVGTTDTPLSLSSSEPRALESEIRFILASIGQYLSVPPVRKDILSVFAGLRPLAAPSGDAVATKEISRDHKLMVSESGLITITGGKWTTYRKMAEETVDAVSKVAALPLKACNTKNIQLHGWEKRVSSSDLSVYGSDENKLKELIAKEPLLAQQLVPGHPYSLAEVVWAVRHEMAMTIEDVLARRLRLLFLDAHAAMRAAPQVARLIMHERDLNEAQMQEQLDEFSNLAAAYLPQPELQVST